MVATCSKPLLGKVRIDASLRSIETLLELGVPRVTTAMDVNMKGWTNGSILTRWHRCRGCAIPDPFRSQQRIDSIDTQPWCVAIRLQASILGEFLALRHFDPFQCLKIQIPRTLGHLPRHLAKPRILRHFFSVQVIPEAASHSNQHRQVTWYEAMAGLCWHSKSC